MLAKDAVRFSPSLIAVDDNLFILDAISGELLGMASFTIMANASIRVKSDQLFKPSAEVADAPYKARCRTRAWAFS